MTRLKLNDDHMGSRAKQPSVARQEVQSSSQQDLPQTPLERKLEKKSIHSSIHLTRKNSDYNWRPHSLRWPYLSFMILFSLCILATIESLRQISIRRNGLAYLPTPDASTGLTVAYNYLPTAVGVIYSTLWFFIDSDVKRLEPYFRMAAKRAPAENLLLDYSFQSPFLVPLRALKKRQLIVAAVAVQFLIISLAFPGSMGALLNIETTTLVRDDQDFRSMGNLRQNHTLHKGNFANQMSSILITPEAVNMPSWATFEYAVEPFEAVGFPVGENETWSATTSVAFAEPQCSKFRMLNQSLTFKCCFRSSEALFYPVAYISAMVELETSTQSCVMSISSARLTRLHPSDFDSGPRSSTFWVPMDTELYAGEIDSSINLTNIGDPNDVQMITSGVHISQFYIGPPWHKDIGQSCPQSPRLAGTYVLSDSGRGPLDLAELLGSDTPEIQRIQNVEQILSERLEVSLTLFACSAEYYATSAQVAVQGHNGSIKDVKLAASEPEVLTFDEFNKTAFEFLLDLDLDPDLFRELDIDVRQQYDAYLEPITPGTLPSIGESSPDLWSINNNVNLADISFDYGMTSFNYTLDHTKPDEFHDAFRKALEWSYRLAFAVAFRGIMVSSEPSNEPSIQELEVTRTTEVFALVATQSFAIVTEVILSLSTITLVCILLVYSRRQSILCSDPDSISASAGLIADQFSSTGPFQKTTDDLGHKSTKFLTNLLQGYELRYSTQERLITLVERDGTYLMKHTPENLLLSADGLPFFLKVKGIILTTIVLISIIILLFCFWILDFMSQGFEFVRPFSSFPSQLVLSFLPSLIATCIESCAISIHRDLSILESYVQLRKGARSAAESLSLRYSTRPPALVAVLSLKNRHYLILLISILCVSTSVLNISMAGLFSPTFKDVPGLADSIPLLRMSNFSTESNPASMLLTDSWNKLWSDLGNVSKQLSFTSAEHSFIPIMLNDTSEISNLSPFTTKISSTTYGVGASLNCTRFSDLAYNDTDLGLVVYPSNDTMFRGAARFAPYDQIGNFTYGCLSELQVQAGISGLNFQLSYPIELNVLEQNVTNLIELDGKSCYSGMILAHTGASKHDTEFHLCQPQMELEIFNLTHDVDGMVYSYTKLSDDQLPADDSGIWMSRETRTDNVRSLLIMFSFQWPNLSSYRRTNLSTFDWPGLLMTRISAKENITSIPQLANEVFSRSFAVWFSLNSRQLLPQWNPGDESISATSTTMTREARIVPSPPAFAVSISLLVLYLASYLLVVFRRRHRYSGPRLPKTIGSVIPWVTHSQMLEDFQGLHYVSTKQRDEILGKLGNKYGFGRFRGKDGRVRLGIEYEEHILAKGAYGDF